MSQLASTVAALRPFVPAKDFELSKRFYLDLGFTLEYDSQDVAELKLGPYSFLLQNYYEPTWAENSMLQLVVTDLDGWWRHVDALRLCDKYAVKPPAAPKTQAWGLKVAYVHDPSGVLLHIVEAPPESQSV